MHLFNHYQQVEDNIYMIDFLYNQLVLIFLLIFLYNFPLKDKTFKGDNMVYKIRLKAREKQAECSTILFLSFLVLVLTVSS